MPNTAIYNMEGKELGKIELNEAVFGIEPSEAAVHTVVVNYLANQRHGTQSALTRAEVRGGGIKPWRQKGTGRARQGSTRAPQWTGGGVVFAPKPRSYRTSVNKKIKKLAMQSVLTSKALSENIIVLDALTVEAIKTKTITEMLKNLNVTGKALLVTKDADKNVYMSARNIPGVDTAFVGTINVYDILNHTKLIIAKDAVELLEEVYA